MLTTPSTKGLRLQEAVNDEAAKPYCGATAIASITGLPISVCKNALRTARFGAGWVKRDRIPVIKGTRPHHVEEALRLLGYSGNWIHLFKRQTLAGWLEKRPQRMKDYPCLVGLTNHWVAVSGWTFCDTWTKGQVVDAEDAPHRRKWVERVFLVSGRVPAQEIPSKLPAAKDPAKRAERNARAKDRNGFKRFLAGYGATFEARESNWHRNQIDDVIVTFPTERGLKPLGIMFYDWDGARQTVLDYLEDPNSDLFDHEEDDEMVWSEY